MGQPMPYPVLIVTGTRTGGTFLSHCLDSHPDVLCVRPEVLDGRCVTNELTKALGPKDKLRLYLELQGWTVSVAKVIYGQVRGEEQVFRWLKRSGGKAIHLTRPNVIRAVVSILARKAVHRGELKGKMPAHTTRPLEPFKVHIPPESLINGAHTRKKLEEMFARLLEGHGIETLNVTYDEIVGGENISAEGVREDTANKLCHFLEVEPLPLVSRLRKGIRWPLRKIVENWEEVKAAVEQSEFAYCLKDEELWEP